MIFGIYLALYEKSLGHVLGPCRVAKNILECEGKADHHREFCTKLKLAVMI
jgi:hypothetical protein